MAATRKNPNAETTGEKAPAAESGARFGRSAAAPKVTPAAPVTPPDEAANGVPAKDFSLDQVRRILLHKDPELESLAGQVQLEALPYKTKS